jgi:hypothetical protein
MPLPHIVNEKELENYTSILINFPAQTSDNSLLSTERTSVQVWSVQLHFNVKGFKMITLHSNFQTFLQHSQKRELILAVLYWIWKEYYVLLFWKSTCNCLKRQIIAPKPLEKKLKSMNCMSYWNLKVFARVPRLDSSYVSICKLQPLYIVISNFWRGLHCDLAETLQSTFLRSA